MMVLANLVQSVLLPAVYLVAGVLGPLIFFVWLIHLFEKLIQYRLSTRFGWNSVLLTGWLGTPVHELSHALMCAVFQHDIVEMALFKPDRENGRLGYVVHTYQPGNFYQEIGNFFIGTAPLIGGTAGLLILLMVFYPDVTRQALSVNTDSLTFWEQVGLSLNRLFTGLFRWQHLSTFRLWLFLYLVVCVGSHMAPSWSDYAGGVQGAILVVLLGLAAGVVAVLLGRDSATLMTVAKPALVPLIAIMILVIGLCVTATTVVFLVTELVDRWRSWQ